MMAHLAQPQDDDCVESRLDAIIQSITCEQGQLPPDFRREPVTSVIFPPEIIKRLSGDQRVRLFVPLCKALMLLEKKKFKRGQSTDSSLKGICSAAGTPTQIRSSIAHNRVESIRCGCNRAWFAIGPDCVRFHLEHVPECKELADSIIAYHGHRLTYSTDLTVAKDATLRASVSRTSQWDVAVRKTAEAWAEKGLTPSGQALFVWSETGSGERRVPKAERVKKAIHDLFDLAKVNPDIADDVLRLHVEARNKHQASSSRVVQVDGAGIEMPGIQPRESSNRKAMATMDASNASKRSKKQQKI
jgi:hypothetical protein